jgi:hypothetical protein
MFIRWSCFTFLLIFSFRVFSFSDSVALYQLIATSTQELIELRELLSEAKKTSDALDKINEYTEKAEHELTRARRLKMWADSLNDIGEDGVASIGDINRVLREFKSSREELSDLVARRATEDFKDKNEIVKNEKEEKRAEDRARDYGGYGSGSSETSLGAANQTGMNTQSIAVETALMNAELKRVNINLTEIRRLMREGLTKQDVLNSSPRDIAKEYGLSGWMGNGTKAKGKVD